MGGDVGWFLGLVILVLVCDLHALAHEDTGSAPDCHRDNHSARLQAAWRPGLITVDGSSADWRAIPALSSLPLQAIQPDPDHPFPHGQLSIKVAHDGHDVFFLVEFPGPYEFAQGDGKRCPSVALMFGIGEDATYHSMGGCKETMGQCSSASCNGHEVDIAHFSVGTAVPGRLYGANMIDNSNNTGRDSFGHLNDMYAWNPHCRSLDGLLPNGSKITNSGAQNEWRGAWSHSSMDSSYGFTSSDSPYTTHGTDGTYTFEFSRPLRTSDRLQQDVQFTIGGNHRFIVAFWYPVDGVAWSGHEHYSASCDWLSLDILPAPTYPSVSNNRTFNILSTFSLLISFGALGASLAVCWWLRSRKHVPFQALDGL